MSTTYTDGPGGDKTTSQDTFLRSDVPDFNYGGYATLFIRNNWTSLLKFDLSGIPASATCDSATLTLYTGDVLAGEKTNQVFVMAAANRTWTEGGATWNTKDGSNAWAGDATAKGCTVSGTDYDATVLGSFVSAASEAVGTEHAVTLTAATVEEFFGGDLHLVIRGTGTGQATVCSSDHGTEGYRPVLTILYTEAAADPPTVTDVDPDSGSVIGGTAVTISGSDFVDGVTVTFGGSSATGVTFVSAAEITCTTPAHAAGAVDVVVTNPDAQTDTLEDGYTYEAEVVPEGSGGTRDWGYAVKVSPASRDVAGLRITDTLNGRSTMTATIRSLDADYRPQLDAPITMSGTTTGGAFDAAAFDTAAFATAVALLFAGTVCRVEEAGAAPGGTALLLTVDGADYAALADHRIISTSFPEGTYPIEVLTALVGYLPGVSLDPTTATGDALEAINWTDKPVNQALDEVCEAAGNWVWYIDPTFVLHAYAPGSVAAPWSMTAAEPHALKEADIIVTTSREDYANRVTVRFSEHATRAYAFLSASGNFSDGETVTIGSKEYRFQTTLEADKDGTVLIGADAEASLLRLMAAITGGPGSGTTYGSATTAHGDVDAYPQTATALKVRAEAPGTSGNSVAVGTSAANAYWMTEGGVPVTTLVLGTDEGLTASVVAEDTDQQAAYGIYDLVISKPEIFDAAYATEVATQALARGLFVTQTVQWTTTEYGLKPGQTISIVLPVRNLNGSYLITDVKTTADQGQLFWAVTAVGGAVYPRTWRDAYRRFQTI